MSLEANAVDLNIKLMKWRVLPALEPEKMKADRIPKELRDSLKHGSQACYTSWKCSASAQVDTTHLTGNDFRDRTSGCCCWARGPWAAAWPGPSWAGAAGGAGGSRPFPIWGCLNRRHTHLRLQGHVGMLFERLVCEEAILMHGVTCVLGFRHMTFVDGGKAGIARVKELPTWSLLSFKWAC